MPSLLPLFPIGQQRKHLVRRSPPCHRPREGGESATCASSVPSCPRTRASMDVAFALAVVPVRTAAKPSRAPLTPTPSSPRRRGPSDLCLTSAVMPANAGIHGRGFRLASLKSNGNSISCAVAPEVLFFAGPKKRTQTKGPSPTYLQLATGRDAGIRRLAILARLRTARVLRAAPSGSHDWSSPLRIREAEREQPEG